MKPESENRLHDGAREKDESLRVVRVFRAVPVVKRRAVVKTVELDKTISKVLLHFQDPDLRPLVSRPERHSEHLMHGIEFQVQFRHLLRIIRHDDMD